MAGMGGRSRQSALSLDLAGARVYKYAFIFSQVPFVNFFPALEPHPLPCGRDLRPFLPPPRLHTVKLVLRAHVGGCRCPQNLLGGSRQLTSAEAGAAIGPFLKRPLPPPARLSAREFARPALCTHLLLVGGEGRKVLRRSHRCLRGGWTGFVLSG